MKLRHAAIRSLFLLSVLLVAFIAYTGMVTLSTSRGIRVSTPGGNPVPTTRNGGIPFPSHADTENTSDCMISVVIRGYFLYFTDDISTNRITWCPRVECNVELVYSSNISDILAANITFFSHLHRSPPLRDIRYLVQHRRSDQRWALMSFETPLRVARNTTLPSSYGRRFYNWLATYNPASDIPITYGKMMHLTEDDDDDKLPKLDSIFKQKSKLIAFVSSNCIHTKWPRLEFVQALQRFIKVDIYGKCGDLTCGLDDNCTNILKDYKFILALENSPCPGYISEKFWRTLSESKSVPIAWGAEEIDYESYTPPGSFIYVESFQSIKKLAAYIEKVGASETLYNSYHKWRDSYRAYIQSNWLNLPNDEQLCFTADRYMTELTSRRVASFKDTNRKDWIQSCRIPVHTKMEKLPIPIFTEE